MQYLFDHAPTGRGAAYDAQGRPVFGQQFKRNPYTFVKPLSDPWGVTDLLGGRHPVAIDARSQLYPSESAFDYQPFAGLTDKYGYNDETKASVVQDYNLKDLSI